jgi:hypothetical protein
VERRLKESIEEIANLYEFPNKVEIQSILIKRNEKRKNRLPILLVPVAALVFIFSYFDVEHGIANLFGNEFIQHPSHTLVHNGHYYVPTDENVKKNRLEDKLGEVTRIGNWTFPEEGDTPEYIPGTKYYSIKGVSEKEKIAVEIWGGTKHDKKLLKYQVLESKEPVMKVDEDIVFSGKSDPKEVSVALDNIRKQIPFFHEIIVTDLKVFSARMRNDGTGFLVNTNYIPTDVKDGIEKAIFVRQYEKGYVVSYDNDFAHEKNKIIETFNLNGIEWEIFEPKYSEAETKENRNRKRPVFIGEKGNIVFEVASQVYSVDEVKKYLESLTSTSVIE